jgi:hypothetical protein
VRKGLVPTSVRDKGGRSRRRSRAGSGRNTRRTLANDEPMTQENPI